MKVAFLGLGKMGFNMARRLIHSGVALTVWNRTAERARPLVDAGAQLAPSAADAIRDADVVMTMLFDDAAVEGIFLGDTQAAEQIQSMKHGALHIALSTISVALSERLSKEHEKHDQLYVAAPVFGRPNVAEEGKLWIVASGADEAISRARPFLEPLSRGISVVGIEPWQAHTLKLGGNFLISAMLHSLGESFVYAKSQGIDPDLFLETVNSALFQSQFYANYGKVMLHPPEHPGATIELGAKDLRLLREAAAARGASLSLADNLADVFAQAREAGLSEEDWAVGQYEMAKRRGVMAKV